MDKPRAVKPKTIQMKYPAPYSQSWASPETQRKPDKHKKKKKNTASAQQNSFPGCCRRTKTRPIHGSDAYAPHLKYGIFPQQSQKSKNAMVNDNQKSAVRSMLNSTTASELIDKGDNKKAKKGQLSDTPLFVIRPIDKRHRRQLSMSETVHLDIKPRKSTPRSPIRKYSPIFKHAIPKIEY